MENTTNREKLDGGWIPVSQQEEGRGGVLFGSGSLGFHPTNESPCHPNPVSACSAGAENQGNTTAKNENKDDIVIGSKVELSPEWKSIHTDYGVGITSTPRVEIERVDLIKCPGGGAQAPRIIEVERVNPEVTEYLTRKRNRIQSRNSEGTTDFSEEGSSEGIAKTGRK